MSILVQWEMSDELAERLEKLCGVCKSMDGAMEFVMREAINLGLDSIEGRVAAPPPKPNGKKVSPKKGKPQRARDQLTKATLSYLDLSPTWAKGKSVQKATGTSCDSKLRKLREQGLVQSMITKGKGGKRALAWNITPKGKKWLKTNP